MDTSSPTPQHGRERLLAAVALALLSTTAAGQPADLTVLFKRLAPSVVVIEGLDASGERHSQGSGVFTAGGVVTNRHVVAEAASIRVRKQGRTWSATIARVDPEHDLALLDVPGFAARPVPLRPSAALETGERVYAIGSPQGLELSLSEGLISSLRPYEGVNLIQTTAPISRGSSGGGLFDNGGRLVGVTRYPN
jgi:serine protease Do